MPYYIQAGPIEDRQIIARGELLLVSRNLDEDKAFWDGEPDYIAPSAIIAHEGATVLVQLKRTAKGWAGLAYRDGFQFGCNLNRVRRSDIRWGLTVWRKSQSEKQTEPEADLSRLLEAIR